MKQIEIVILFQNIFYVLLQNSFFRSEKAPLTKSKSKDTAGESDTEDEACLLSGRVETTEDWSPSSADSAKEQYMFLGNVYTVTRAPTKSMSNQALVAVTPAVTEEDLHVLKENGYNGIEFANEKTLGGETTPDCEVDQFWMDLDINDDQSLKSKTKIKKTVNSDISKPGMLPLRTVVE